MIKIQKKCGYIYNTFKESHLSSLYKQINTISGSKTFLISSENIVLSGVGTYLETGASFLAPELMNHLIIDGYFVHDTFFFSYQNTEYLTAYSLVPNTDIFLVSMIPKSYLFDSNRPLVKGFFVSSFLAFLLAFLLAIMVAQSILKPIANLKDKMTTMQYHNFTLLSDDSSKDEVAILNNQFNKMVTALFESSRQKEAAQNDMHKMQLVALQAQINPHFLVNTLNTVKWLATYQNAPNIEELSNCLINLLYETIGKGDELITIEAELSCLKDYAIIQSYRYMDKIQLSIKTDESLKKHKIPRFLIQPLVENSIIHGLSDADTKGSILVSVTHDSSENTITISVTDNGVGLSEEKINHLLHQETKTKGMTNFGIYNVDQRIKLYFGEPYGLTITSIPFICTTFKIVIPYKRDEESNVPTYDRR